MSEQKLQTAALRWAEDAGIWDADEAQDDATAFAQLAQLFNSSEEPDNPRLLIRKADSHDDHGR